MLRSRCQLAFASLIVALALGSQNSAALAQKKAAPVQEDPQMLSLEVAALRILGNLDLTDAQLESLVRLSKGAASQPKSQGRTKVTPAFMKTLSALRQALLDDDDDRVDDLRDKLADIMDKDKIQLEDRMPISDAARRNANQVLRLLQPGQVLAYLQIMDEEEVEVFAILEEALDRGKGADAAKWKVLRDQAAADAAWLLVGSDEVRTRAAVKMLGAILDQHHGAKSKNAVPDLEKQAEQLTANIDPFLILRNAMEREMAELLSNPQLPLAIQHTLQQRRKTAAK